VEVDTADGFDIALFRLEGAAEIGGADDEVGIVRHRARIFQLKYLVKVLEAAGTPGGLAGGRAVKAAAAISPATYP
jgi:hypothetical protein